MEYLKVLNVFIYIVSGSVSAYSFWRVLFYPLIKFLVDEKELQFNPKVQKSMNIFYHARLYPWPTWDSAKRTAWVKAWWKYAIICVASFIIMAFTLYINEVIKL